METTGRGHGTHTFTHTHTLTLYLLKAFWMMRAASYSSLCSPSVRVSRAKSLSIFPLADAFRNSAHAAEDGGRSLWSASALRGEGGRIRLHRQTKTVVVLG